MSDDYKHQIERRIDKLEEKVDNLLAWRNWVVGIVAGVGLMIGAFAKNVADIMRHL